MQVFCVLFTLERFMKKILVVSGIAAALAVMPVLTQAANPTTTTFTVNADVANVCTIAASGNMTFNGGAAVTKGGGPYTGTSVAITPTCDFPEALQNVTLTFVGNVGNNVTYELFDGTTAGPRYTSGTALTPAAFTAGTTSAFNIAGKLTTAAANGAGLGTADTVTVSVAY